MCGCDVVDNDIVHAQMSFHVLHGRRCGCYLGSCALVAARASKCCKRVQVVVMRLDFGGANQHLPGPGIALAYAKTEPLDTTEAFYLG